MEKILIETYKDQDIYYDPDSDKFLCEMVIEDDYKKTSRISLKAVRKEIDLFVKANENFKPFDAIMYQWSSYNLVRFLAKRTDGVYVYEKRRGGGKSHYDFKDKLFKYNYDVVKKVAELSCKRKEFIDKIDNEIKAEYEKLEEIVLTKP